DVAGASMLDEGTAAAEGMLLARRATKAKVPATRFLVDRDLFRQTRAVLQTRAAGVGIELVPFDVDDEVGPDTFEDAFGVLIQLPGASGRIPPRAAIERLVSAAHDAGAQVVMAADLLAAALVASPRSEEHTSVLQSR